MIEGLMGRAIMATDPDERLWYEDQILVNLHSGRNLRGNSQTVVVATDRGDASYGATEWDAIVAQPESAEFLSRSVADLGWRVIDGRALFTKSDRPRPYRAPQVTVADLVKELDVNPWDSQ